LSRPENVTTIIFKTFEDNGLIRKIRKRDDGQILWGLTSHGKFMKTNNNKSGA
jgi:hypothetical protein